jgi:hypothetical protein
MQELLRALALGPQTLAWFGLQLLLMILGALVAGGTPLRRAASLPLMLGCLLLPIVAPLAPVPRALLAVLGLLGLLKMSQLDYEPRWAAQHPVWHGLSPFDVSTARRAPPAFDVPVFGMVLLHAALLALVVAGLLHLPRHGSPLREPLRLLFGASLVYGAMETATEGLRFGHRLFGWDVPPIQRAPVLSRSVGEFWSKRWNRPVSAWLNEYAFLPLARRRRPLLGLLAAFVASAALHAWMYYAGLGLWAALSAGAYFLLQAPVVMLETKLRVSRWPGVLARAWTLAWLLGTSPLFVAPLLRGLGL